MLTKAFKYFCAKQFGVDLNLSKIEIHVLCSFLFFANEVCCVLASLFVACLVLHSHKPEQNFHYPFEGFTV